MHRTSLAVTVAAILAVAVVAPAALGTRHATPDLYEVTMLGTYSELRETIPPRRSADRRAHMSSSTSAGRHGPPRRRRSGGSGVEERRSRSG